MFDYDEPDLATQEAVRATGLLVAATIRLIVNSVSISDGRYGSEPGAGGLACGTWGSDESATCGELWYAVELA
jgi:hypothetical protein